jgi:hypothetical protein
MRWVIAFFVHFPINPLISSYSTAPSVRALNGPEVLASLAMRRSKPMALSVGVVRWNARAGFLSGKRWAGIVLVLPLGDQIKSKVRTSLNLRDCTGGYCRFVGLLRCFFLSLHFVPRGACGSKELIFLSGLAA